MQEEVESLLDGFFEGNDGLPAAVSAGVADAGLAVLAVLIAFAVEGAGFDLLVACERREFLAQRMFLEFVDEDLRQFADARFVVRIPDVDDLAVAEVTLVLDDAEEAFDAVCDMREAAFLRAAVDELDRIALDEVEDQLRDGAGAADAGGGERVELRA